LIETLPGRVMRRYAYVGRHRPSDSAEPKVAELGVPELSSAGRDVARLEVAELALADAGEAQKDEDVEQSGSRSGGAADLPAGDGRLRLRRRSGVLKEKQRDVVLELAPGDPLGQRTLE
jgi:hypothetical protein